MTAPVIVRSPDVETFRSTMVDLNSVMVSQINRELQRTNHLDTDVRQRWMTDAYPEIWTPFAATAGDLAAQWYREAAPDLAYTVITVLLPPQGSIAGQVAWAFAQHAMTHALLAVAQRDLWNEARRTVAANADREDGAKWARHASANACRFCQMLATRGPVYASKKAASEDHDSARGLFGKKEKYHKHCHCLAVPVRPGKVYEPPSYVDQWNEDYEKAARLAGGSRTAKSVMAAYRQMDKQ